MQSFLGALFAKQIFWDIPGVLTGLVLLYLAGIYFYRHRLGAKRFTRRLKVIIWAVIGGRFAYAAFLTFAQYYVWARNEATKVFISSPAAPASLPKLGFLTSMLKGKSGYFYLYSFDRFWLGAIISILAGYIFYRFLLGLKKYKGRFFEDGEIELGFALALVAGWPLFVVFLMFIFLFVVAISVFRIIFMKQKYTTLGLPFILGAILALFWGMVMIDALGWGGIKV